MKIINTIKNIFYACIFLFAMFFGFIFIIISQIFILLFGSNYALKFLTFFVKIISKTIKWYEKIKIKKK